MKLGSYRMNDSEQIGVFHEGLLYPLAACMQAAKRGNVTDASSMLTFLAAGEPALEAAQEAIAWTQSQGNPDELTIPVEAVQLRAPIPCPGKLLCLAGNYADHILEGGRTVPGKETMNPRFFIKPCTAIIAHGDPIRIPPSSARTDWELELAVVIGKRGRDIPVEKATDHIAGYTVFNDISARSLTFRQTLPKREERDTFFDWLVGKWLDTFAPMGPWLTTADEVGYPVHLDMKLWVNDELHQNGNTGQMIFSPAEAIAFISQFVTLEPGDIICTGTPAGVGNAKNLGLKPGDRVRGQIEGLGILENPVESLSESQS